MQDASVDLWTSTLSAPWPPLPNVDSRRKSRTPSYLHAPTRKSVGYFAFTSRQIHSLWAAHSARP